MSKNKVLIQIDQGTVIGIYATDDLDYIIIDTDKNAEVECSVSRGEVVRGSHIEIDNWVKDEKENWERVEDENEEIQTEEV